MKVISRTPINGVTINDIDDRITKDESESIGILPSTESYEYKRMLSMLGFNVDLPEEPEKSDSEKFNIVDYVVFTL